MTDSPSPVRTYVLDTSVLLSDPWAATRFAEHEVVVPLVVISELEAKRHHHELGWFARQALRLFDDLRVEHGTAGSADSRWCAGRHAARRAQSQRSRGAAGGISYRHQRRTHPDLRGQPRGRGQASDVGEQGHSAAREGQRGRARRRRVPRPRRHRVGLDGNGRARGIHRRHRRAVRRWRDRSSGRARSAVPHRNSIAGRRLARTGPGQRRQAGAACPRRPRGVRTAWPLGRATGRAGSAARRIGRHRVAGRQGRHRQVGAGAVRGPGGRAGAAHPPQGRGVPAAVCRRRPGSRLPAGQREREDGSVGAGRLRHAGGAGQSRRCSRRCCRAVCSRCSR